MVWLVARGGDIVLRRRERRTGRRRNIARQHARTGAERLELVTVALGESVAGHGGVVRPKGTYNEIAVPGSYGAEEPDYPRTEEKGA